MSVKEHASGLISGALILPIGALDYVWGGWTLVAMVAVFCFVLGLGLTAYTAWREASA